MLVWPFPHVPAASAANDTFTPLFLGSLNGSASLNPSAADRLFTSLATHATSSIDIALYDFNRPSVRDALIAAKGRGLAVRVVGDNDDSVDSAYQPTYNAVQMAGIPVVNDTKSSLMHNKFAVFDNQVTWTGSVNFSDTGFTLNGENALVITSTMLADIYHTEFNELFSGKFSNDKTNNTVHTVTVGTVPIEVAFAPTDGVQQRIINAINTANSSVQVTMFTFTNQAIAQTLIAAKQRGVTVEVILDSLAAGSQFSQRDPLCAAGITVRVEDWDGKLHDKYAVVDASTISDPLILTGSTNWTGNAVSANDENLLIVHDPDLAQAYAGDFARLRGAISPTAFACNAAASPSPTDTPTPTATATATAANTATATMTASPTSTATSISVNDLRTAYLSVVVKALATSLPTAASSATDGPGVTMTSVLRTSHCQSLTSATDTVRLQVIRWTCYDGTHRAASAIRSVTASRRSSAICARGKPSSARHRRSAYPRRAASHSPAWTRDVARCSG